MIPDKNRIFDGWVSMEGGVDSGRDKTIIDQNQCVSAENMTFRGGNPSTRPGIRLIREVNQTPTVYYYGPGTPSPNFEGQFYSSPIPSPLPSYLVNQDSNYVYRNGVMQGFASFSPHYGEDCLIASIGGRIYRIVPQVSTASVYELPLTVRNRNNIPVCYMLQADKWFLIQDGESQPIIYDGSLIRRSIATNDPNKTEVPTGTIMAYGMGRIVVVVNQRDIAFGDLFGSHLDTQTDPSDSLILFTERNFLAGGFDAAIPFQNGVVTGMAFFPQLDTSTGNGQLLVFAERGASSFFLSLPRDQWQTSQFQIQALTTTGLRGHRSISAVNEDLWFRADDGARSYRQARSEPSGWAHIPLSTNVDQFFNSDSETLLKFVSSIYFDNRIIFTTSPAWNNGRPFHPGMVAVDFDVLSSFGQKFRPTWDGHWTMPNSLSITQVATGTFNGVTRAFAFGIDANGLNQLYELSIDDVEDAGKQKIPWQHVSRGFNFSSGQQSTPFTESELYDADLWVKEVRDQRTYLLPSIKVSYRPDGYPDWLPWNEFNEEFGIVGTAGAIGQGGIPTASPGFAPRLSFGKPPDKIDPTTSRNLRRGYNFQVKLDGLGNMTLDKFRIHAQKLVERSTAIS